MKEISNLMKNTIVLLMTIVVGGAGALLERVQICNLPEVGKTRSSSHKIDAQGFESPAPPSFMSFTTISSSLVGFVQLGGVV